MLDGTEGTSDLPDCDDEGKREISVDFLGYCYRFYYCPL